MTEQEVRAGKEGEDKKMRLYVAMQLQPFELTAPAFPRLPVRVDAGKLVGYLPVFACVEDLREEFPDAPYATIERGVRDEQERGE